MKTLLKMNMRSGRKTPLSTLLTLSCWLGYSQLSAEKRGSDWMEPSKTSMFTVNEAIEPKLKESDRSLYQRVSPLLLSQPEQAFDLILGETNPEDRSPVFSFLLGSLSYQLDKFQETETHLQQSLKSFPSFRRALRLLAIAQVRLEKFELAQNSITRVIALGGGDEQSYGLLAQLHEQQSHHASALSSYRMARMFAPDQTALIRGEAHAHLQLSDHAQAVSLLNELIGSGEGQTRDWRWLSQAYLGMGDHALALANLEVLRGSNQADQEALLLLGHLYFEESLFEKALEVYELALEQGRVAKGEDQNQKAMSSLLPSLERLVQLEHWNLAGKLRNMLVQVKDKSATKVERDQWDVLSLAIDLSAVSSASGANFEKLLTQCQSLVDRAPMFGPGLMLMAKIQKSRGHLDMAEFYYERAAERSDVAVQAWMALGECAVEQQQYAKAFGWYEKVHEKRGGKSLEAYLSELKQIGENKVKSRYR